MNDRIKLWYALPSLDCGGRTRIATALMKYLDTKKFELKIITLKKGPLHEIMPRNNEIHHLGNSPPFWAHGKVLESTFHFRRIRKLMRYDSPSVVLGDVTGFNTMLLLNRIMSGKPKHLFVRMGNIKSKSLKIERDVKAIVQYLSIKYLFPKATAIITPTQAAKDDLVTNFKIPREQIYLVPNPLDIEAIQAISSEPVDHPWFNDNTPIVTTVGRLIPRKGIVYLIQAMSILRNKVNCRLVIIGGGPLRASLQAGVRERKLDDCVTFLGEQVDAFKFIAKSTIYVHPALSEGFGYVIVEAMACGIPVIAMKGSGGPEDIITDGVDGFLVRPANPEAIATAILKLLNDNVLRNKIILKGKEKAKQFDAKKAVSIYEKIFCESVAKST